jgi:hypothetical protein
VEEAGLPVLIVAVTRSVRNIGIENLGFAGLQALDWGKKATVMMGRTTESVGDWFASHEPGCRPWCVVGQGWSEAARHSLMDVDREVAAEHAGAAGKETTGKDLRRWIHTAGEC